MQSVDSQSGERTDGCIGEQHRNFVGFDNFVLAFRQTFG